MKYIIIGLGNFGSMIAELLTQMGNEVIGVDKNMGKVEALKEKITHTICLDATDPGAINNLPLRDTDVIMVCIGENEGANLLATALMKQQNPKRLISRAVSPLHETILEAMGVTEIVHPEEEAAKRWSNKLEMKEIVDSFELCDGYSIVEIQTPKRFIDKTIGEIQLRNLYNLLALTIIKMNEEKNLLGVSRKVQRIKGVATAETILREGDIMVLYGHINNIKKFIGDD